MKRIHYSWVICIACVLLLVVCSGLMVTSFTAFMPYIVLENGFSNTEVNLITTIRSLASFVAKMFAVALIHKIDVRKTVLLSCSLATVAYLSFTFAPNLLGYYCAAALAGVSNGLGSMIPATIILNRWFKIRLHVALGFSAAGSAVAVMVCPPVIAGIAESFGLRAAFLLVTAVILIITIITTLVIRNYPEEVGLQAYGFSESNKEEKKKAASVAEKYDFSAVEMNVLCAAPFLIGAVGLTCTSIYSLHCGGLGFNSMTTAMATSVYGAALLAGKLLYGISVEAIGGSRTNGIFLACTIGGSILSCFSGGSVILLIASSILVGMGLALCTVGISSWAADLIHPKNFDKAVGRFQISYTLGGLIFSLVPGPVADYVGSYVPVFAVYACMAVVVLTVILWAYKKNGNAAERTKE